MLYNLSLHLGLTANVFEFLLYEIFVLENCWRAPACSSKMSKKRSFHSLLFGTRRYVRFCPPLAYLVPFFFYVFSDSARCSPYKIYFSKNSSSNSNDGRISPHRRCSNSSNSKRKTKVSTWLSYLLFFGITFCVVDLLCVFRYLRHTKTKDSSNRLTTKITQDEQDKDEEEMQQQLDHERPQQQQQQEAAAQDKSKQSHSASSSYSAASKDDKKEKEAASLTTRQQSIRR